MGDWASEWQFDNLFSFINVMAAANSDSEVYAGPSSANKLKGYGCTCRNLNPFAKNLGAPLDEMDKACQAWKLCVRCVKNQHGEVCGNDYRSRNGQCLMTKALANVKSVNA